MKTLLLLALVGCGNPATSGTYAAKCQLACVPPSGPCANQDSTMCQQSCVATTEGLTAICAQCITEHSGWYGTYCINNCKASFGPSGRGNTACGSGSTCGASDEACSGFEIGKVSSSDCMTICAQP